MPDRLVDSSATLDGVDLDSTISSVLFPGGLEQPGRAEGEAIIESYEGRVVGWFTVKSEVESGGHPDEVRKAWLDVPLPVREGRYPFIDEVEVVTIDGFNALADSRAPESVLQYWADNSPRHLPASSLPVFVFPVENGVLEDNLLLDW